MADPIVVLIVTGLSGSGKTTAMRALEDVGFFCVDNLPLALMPKFLLLCEQNTETPRVAMAVDARSEAFGPPHKDALDEVATLGHDITVLFLDARDEVLIRRFSETRRRHPLSDEGMTLQEGIQRERDLLIPLRAQASLVIDTSSFNVHELRKDIVSRYGLHPEEKRLQIVVKSFGFKYGLPVEADYVFDVRFLPNPYFIDELRPRSGLESEVQEYLINQPQTHLWMERILPLLDFVVPWHETEGKLSLTVAIGCTGGRHRSVFTASKIGDHLEQQGFTTTVRHRDIHRSSSASSAPD
jgi:UPF0042 nucleotide-binding protein